MDRKKQIIIMAGYGAALAGILVYLFSRETAGMMLGGLFLCATSAYKLLGNRNKKE